MIDTIKPKNDSFKLISKEISEHVMITNSLNDYLHEIDVLSQKFLKLFKNNKKLLIAGNGGSAADAQHFSSELIGKYEKERVSLASISLSTDPSSVTAISNDYGYENVFSRQVEGLGEKGDILLAISTSGNSLNLINAVKTAKKRGIESIGLLGMNGGILKQEVDFSICIDSKKTARIQEAHGLIIHIICKIIDKNLN